MDGLELICFEIISCSGSARSCFVEAMEAAGTGDYEGARKLITEGEENYQEAHNAHSELIQKEASGEPQQVTMILAHAEDQLMSAEVIRIMAEQILSLREAIDKLK